MKYSKKRARLNVQSKKYNVVLVTAWNVFPKNIKNLPIASHLGLDLVHNNSLKNLLDYILISVDQVDRIYSQY